MQKHDWLKHNYAYISNEELFTLGDIFTLAKYINENLIEIYYMDPDSSCIEWLQWKNDFYMKLWESILKWIGSKFTMDNYINLEFEKDTFPGHRKECWYRGLVKMRDSYLNVVHCFSNQYVWSPWRNLEKCSNFEKMKKEVGYYGELEESLKENIINISNLIWEDLGEDISKYVSFSDLKSLYWFDTNLDEIQEMYFRL